jgi:hypothetical protein
MIGWINKIAVGLFFAALILFAWANRSGKFAVRPFDHGSVLKPLSESEPLKPDQMEVRIGIFAENIYGYDISTQSVAAEGWLWVTWPEAFQKFLEEDDVTIDKVIAPINQVNSWDAVLKPAYGVPVRLPDGRYYQLISFSCRFYVDNLDLHRYPFETLTVPIAFGPNLLNEHFGSGKVRFVGDSNQSGVGPYVDIIGYATDHFQMRSYRQHYPSGFGLRGTDGHGDTDFGQVRLEVTYKKSGFASMMHLILPLIVVMLIVILAPNLAASLWDVRIAIPSTALLTLAFLQQTYRAGIPPLPYLTYLDQIYGVCYVVTFGLFVLFVWSSNKLDGASESEKPALIARLNRIDSRVQWFFIFFMIITTVLNWYFPLKY